ncbi:MAG: SDR family oxidoreductase [Halopseudomonas sp.]
MNPNQMQVLITGASGGIGRETARLLSQFGARILAVGRNSKALDSLMESLSPHSTAAHQCFCADICDASQRQQLLSDLEHQGIQPNVLINMAGTNQLALFEDQSESQIERIINTNLTATLLLTHALLPVLKQQPKARIINVGSTFGSIGYPGYVSYCTSKFALRGFTEALQRELSDSAIRVQYFAPRATQTSLNSQAAEKLNAQLNNAVDTPEQVAKALATLLWSNDTCRFLGWPEKLFVKINGLFPSVVSSSINKQLAVIKQFASQP